MKDRATFSSSTCYNSKDPKRSETHFVAPNRSPGHSSKRRSRNSAAGATGQIMARADSAYYGHAFVAAALRAKAWFSVTARMKPQVVAAISHIPADAWTPIAYPNALWEEAEGRWISEAEVAETTITVFTSRRKADQVTCRLVVRRVKRLNPAAHAGQGELFDAYRHHGFITNSTLGTIEADTRHRDHAVIEQVIAELKDGLRVPRTPSAA
jgi:hypothetical protein